MCAVELLRDVLGRNPRCEDVCNERTGGPRRIVEQHPGMAFPCAGSRGKKHEFAPAEAVRYRERSAAERVNSHLHDNHGGRHVRVRGAAKVAAHLSFGLLVIVAEQLLNLLC